MFRLNPVPALRRLVSELTRRRVVHAVAVYGVVAWVAIQVAAIAFPALYIPDAALTVLVFLAVLGFPVTVALAWAFEITDEGVRRTPQLAEDEGLSPALRGFFAACVVVATAGLGWAGWETWLSPRAGAQGASASEEGAAPGDRPADGPDGAERAEELSPSRVAVLYFEDRSAGDSLRAFADGLTENLIHRLTQVEGLEVVSRRGVRGYRSGQATLDSVARELGAGSLVEGSVRSRDDTLEATVRLIDGRSGTHQMSRTLTRPVGDLFELQDALAREVARLLRQQLGREIQLETWRSRTASVEAWRRVQEADRLRVDADSLENAGQDGAARRLLAQADSLLARASELDPDWNAPETLRAELALVRVDPAAPSWGEEEKAAVREAIAYADRAVEKAPSDADALRVRGRLRFWLSRRTEDAGRSRELVERAERDLRAAVREDPGSAKAWFALSELLLEGRGQFGDALYAAERAREADAYLRIPSDIHFQFFYTAANMPDWDAAWRWCETGQEEYPENVGFRSCELMLLASEGAGPPDPERAWELLEEIRARSTSSQVEFFQAISRREVAAVLARAGLEDSARAVLRRARRDSSPPAEEAPILYYEEAHVHLLLGEEEKALELVSKFAEHEPGFRSHLEGDPWMEPLRDRPEYRELLEGG